MTVIIDIDHEAGDLSEWSSTVNDGGDLSAAVGAALAGSSYGMEVLIDDTTAIYGIYTLGTDDTSGVVRIRFYFDPNSITMGNSNHFIGALRSSSNIATIKMEYDSGTGYAIQAQLVAEGGTVSTSYYPITDAPHYIEIQVVRATTISSLDGTLDLWIDGDHKEQLVDDNFNIFTLFRQLRLGATSGIDSTTSGSYYIDEIVVNNDGSEIGAVGGGGSTETLTADEGSFALNGQAQTFAITMPAEHGSFS